MHTHTHTHTCSDTCMCIHTQTQTPNISKITADTVESLIKDLPDKRSSINPLFKTTFGGLTFGGLLSTRHMMLCNPCLGGPAVGHALDLWLAGTVLPSHRNKGNWKSRRHANQRVYHFVWFSFAQPFYLCTDWSKECFPPADTEHVLNSAVCFTFLFFYLQI